MTGSPVVPYIAPMIAPILPAIEIPSHLSTPPFMAKKEAVAAHAPTHTAVVMFSLML